MQYLLEIALKPLSEEERKGAAQPLAEYWKERGMPEYDQKWAEDYLREGHKKEIKNDEFFTYTEGDKLIGTISLITDVSDVAEIRDMVIKEEYRRKGYGRKILEEIVKLAKEKKIRKLYALISPTLEKLFQEAGFEKEGILKNHFVEGENLTIMSKFLKE